MIYPFFGHITTLLSAVYFLIAVSACVRVTVCGVRACSSVRGVRARAFCSPVRPSAHP